MNWGTTAMRLSSPKKSMYEASCCLFAGAEAGFLGLAGSAATPFAASGVELVLDGYLQLARVVMTLLVEVSQSVSQSDVFLRVEQVASTNHDAQSVVEECLGETEMEYDGCFRERQILLVTLCYNLHIGTCGECGQNLDVIVEINQEDRSFGTDEATGSGDLNPVSNHAQRELWLIDAELWSET